VGSPTLEDPVYQALSEVSSVAIGPRASQAGFKPKVAIDTGVAGIHEGGIAYRMDEVPLALRPPLSGPRATTDALRSLTEVIRRDLDRRHP
jgi:formylmethanofuran dehydrogenase subunit B